MKKLIIALLLVAGLLFSPLAPAADAQHSCWNFYSGDGWKGYGAGSYSESGGRIHIHALTIGSTSSCGVARASDLYAWVWIDKWVSGTGWVNKASFVDSDHDGAAWAYTSTAATPGTYRIAYYHVLYVNGYSRPGWKGYDYYTT